jgi:hypothetical protein
MGRGQGQHQVGTGVAVGYWKDVEVVDLPLVPAQPVETGRAPAADGNGVQDVQHGLEAY